MTRPGTLAEAIRRTQAGSRSFGFNVSEFLDEFYLDDDPASRASRLRDLPETIGTPTLDAYVGAIAEHLSRRWRLGRAPAWSDEAVRFLDEPYFTAGPAMHPVLLMESPVAFRRRFIFTEAEPLRRVRMPEDGRWWAYETLRSGLTPPAGRFPPVQVEDLLASSRLDGSNEAPDRRP